MLQLTEYEKQTIRDLRATRVRVGDIAAWMHLPLAKVREVLGSPRYDSDESQIVASPSPTVK